MHSSLFSFLVNHVHVFIKQLTTHIALSFSATILAILVGLPLGIWAYQQSSVRKIILSITSVFQTIPSLALLALLIPILGIGFKPTIVTLMFYALLPITRNTYTGLSQLPKETIEAAIGLGFTRWQRLRMVELPIATPIIIAGIRTATAMTIGITTIAAFIGAGGLGTFITEGLALNDSRLILLGAIPTALLALIVDYIIAQLEFSLSAQKRQQLRLKKTKLTTIILLAGFFIFSYGKYGSNNFFSKSKNTIVVASKNFTESYILAYLMSELIEKKTKLHVINKFNLGSTAVIQNALLKGAIDIYPEYTGTAYIAILKHQRILSPRKTYKIVSVEYKKRFNLIWLPPFGFSNMQTLAVTKYFSKAHHIKTLSDLSKISSQLTLAAPAAFLKRGDAFPALQNAYHFKFKNIIQMQPDLVYDAIKNKNVQVIEVFTTDARIQAFNLKPLKDDKNIYPPYYAAAIIQSNILKKHPEIRSALEPLFGSISEKTIRQLNAAVTLQHRTPKAVAHQFLMEKGLLS